ncbi:putative ribonuclease H-like domain-containing protein [Tanacetum coccineum]
MLGLKDFKMILRVTTAQYCWYKSLCCWIITARRITTVRRIKMSKEIRIVWRTRILMKINKLRNRSRIGINKWYQSFALRNFDLEVMEFESRIFNTTAKLPILKLENGNSWVSIPQTAQENGTSVTKMSVTDAKTMFVALSNYVWRVEHQRNKGSVQEIQTTLGSKGNNEDTSLKAMLAIDGVGFDWSDMGQKHNFRPNMALMAFLGTSKAATYKRGLATVEEQLITYRKNEVLFSEEVAVLKREVACKDYEINVLKSEFEKVKQEKEGIEFKIEKFDKASKDLDKLLGSQITDKSKKGLGYNVVPPPHPLIYNRPKKLDLSYSGLDEFKDPEFKSYGSEDSKQESNIVCDKKSDDSKENSDDSLVKEQVSEDTSSFVESSLNVDKETIFLDKKIECVKPKNHEKLVKKSVRLIVNTIKGKGWYKGIIIKRVNYNYTTNRTHPNAQRNMVPRAGLMKTGLKPFNTARTVNTAHPKSIVFSAKSMSRFSKLAQSTAKADNTVRPHLAVVNAVRVNQANADKPQQDDSGFIDNGCSRHMTGNIAYLSDFKEFDEGYVTFGGGAHGGRISGKGTLKTDSLDFKDVYFVNELKFNLFSVSQMCDKKNYVLFTDTECLVLSPNFKLPDESQILLKIPRKDNMYSFDMKNIVPKESLTCLVAKATSDESMLWHRRLGHINFKNINKLVKDNLVRGTITNESACTQGELNVGTSTQKEEISQDCIVMLIWKDASYFDSPSKYVGNGEPKSAANDQKQTEDGTDNENDEKDKSEDDSIPKEVNAAGQHVNTASPKVNTGSFKLNTVDLSVSTASSNDQDSPKDMFKLGASHTLETTYVEFFSDEDEP